MQFVYKTPTTACYNKFLLYIYFTTAILYLLEQSFGIISHGLDSFQFFLFKRVYQPYYGQTRLDFLIQPNLWNSQPVYGHQSRERGSFTHSLSSRKQDISWVLNLREQSFAYDLSEDQLVQQPKFTYCGRSIVAPLLRLQSLSSQEGNEY